MPKINQVENHQKEIYMHFKPNELRIFGAYMYGYQDRLPFYDKEGKVQPLPPYYINPNSRMHLAWTIYDRFRMAYQTFDTEMKRNPELNRDRVVY